MDWKIMHSSDPDLVRVYVSGTFKAEEFSLLFEQILTHDLWRPGKPILFDNRQMDLKGVDYSSINTIKNSFQADDLRFGHSRIALLKKSLADFGVGRQFQTMTEDKVLAEFGVFQDESAALTWLFS